MESSKKKEEGRKKKEERSSRIPLDNKTYYYCKIKSN
tara:strand:- start:333 stop:443 length:111 start_codon:yes stop_codon:yes gene_type:complete